MKQKKNLFLKSLLSIVLSGAILMSGMILIGASGMETKSADDPLISPDVTDIVEMSDGETEIVDNAELEDSTVGRPIEAQEFEFPTLSGVYGGKFDAYNTVTEENGLDVVTVYSPETVSDFASRRANGEWFKLTEQEILYIISDTKELLNEYDVVRVYNLDGSVNEYYGAGYYYSDAYYDSFGVAPENANNSFDINVDFHYASLDRITVLHSAVAKEWKDPNGMYVVRTDLEGYPEPTSYTDNGVVYERSIEEELQLYASSITWYYKYNIGDYPVNSASFLFGSGENSRNPIYITADGTVYALNANDGEYVHYKYDCNSSEKSITIEVWNNAENTVAARIRLENDTDAEVIAEIENLWIELEEFLHSDEYELLSADYYFTESDYSVVVYYHGEDSDRFVCPIYHYKPDGNLNEWSYASGPRHVCQLDGAQDINAYINDLLSERLLGE